MTLAAQPAPVEVHSCDTNIDCDNPGTDGCTYDSHSKQYIVQCNTDYYGDDIAITQTDDLTQCVEDCAAFVGCRAASWSTGTCYLKESMTEGLYNQWVMGRSCCP
jgi:hypothetical protein